MMQIKDYLFSPASGTFLCGRIQGKIVSDLPIFT
jgi:hypothetical protein